MAQPEFEYIDNKKTSSSVKILAIGDPHFKIGTLSEMTLYTQKIIESVRRENPDFVIILGDLLHDHEKVHIKVLNSAYNLILELRRLVKVFIMVGNHDYINNQQYRTDNHWMNGMKEWENVSVVDQGEAVDTRAGKFVMVPYVFPGRFIECLDDTCNDWREARVVFAHQEIYGCKMGAIVSETGDKWPETNPMVISGHIHDKQRVQPNVFYTGSSLQHAFGESHDKTISLITLTDNKLVVEKISLELSSKNIIYKNIGDMDKFKCPLDKDSTDQLRITASGTVDEYKAWKKTKQFRDLQNDSRLKIVFKEQNQKNILPGEYKEKSFGDILYELIKDEPEMLSVYNKVK